MDYDDLTGCVLAAVFILSTIALVTHLMGWWTIMLVESI